MSRAAVVAWAALAVAGCTFHVLPISDAAAPADDLAAPADLAAPDLARPIPDGAVPRGNGFPCATSGDCASGACVDGYCCESPCAAGDPGNLCKACNVPGFEGRCVAALAGTDPHQECEPDPVATCGKDGLCDGAGGCRKYVAGTPCGQPPAVCDGNGSCGGRADGQPCMQPTDCVSGFCADGVCCDSDCGGECRACNLAGRVGVCSPEPAGTGCAPPGCAMDGTVSARSCDAAGTCLPGITRSCSPYSCNPAAAACFTKPCANSKQCAVGHTCNPTSQKCM